MLERRAITVAEEKVLRILAFLLHMELFIEFWNITVSRFKNIELGHDKG